MGRRHMYTARVLPYQLQLDHFPVNLDRLDEKVDANGRHPGLSERIVLHVSHRRQPTELNVPQSGGTGSSCRNLVER